MAGQTLHQRTFDLLCRTAGLEHHIATGDIGPYLLKARGFAHGLEFCHGQFACSPTLTARSRAM